METTFIYELIDPLTSETKYIGKSNRPNIRFKEHFYDKKRTHKTNWIKSLLKQGVRPILRIIDEVNFNEWEFWEQHYIDLYKSWGFNLTNSERGGKGPGRQSKETKSKISFFQKGRPKSKEVRNKLKKVWIEKSQSEKEKICERLLLHAKQLGKTQTKERVEVRSAPQRVKVLQKDLQGTLIKEWEGIAYAAKTLGIAKTSISSTLQGNLKRAGGFIWEYKDQNVKEQQALKYKNRKQN